MNTRTIRFSELEDNMIMCDGFGSLLRVSDVEQFEDNGLTAFKAALLDGSEPAEMEFEDWQSVEIADECDEDLSEEAFLDFLDSVYGDEVQVCGYAMNPGRVLREMDNVAFTQMHNDWTDMHETECGQH